MKQIALSPLELLPDASMRRAMPRPAHLRPPDYEEKFDSLTVFYDCFVSADGAWRVLLGPPPLNLKALILSSFPSLFGSESPAQVRLVSPTPESREHFSGQLWLKSTKDTVDLPIDDFRQTQIVVQPNESKIFEGRKVLLTLSKNNEIRWIRDWVRFFARRHECDAVLFYDNASTSYDAADLHDAISSIPGIEATVVVNWPYKYGPQGSDSYNELLREGSESPPLPWDSHFCQPGMLEHARHRFLSLADAVVNADIDELVLTEGSEPLFDLVRLSKTGYLHYKGLWVEGATETSAENRRHFHFCHRAKVPARGFLWKWAVAPHRCPQEASWLPHKISNMKPDPLSSSVSYRHFRAINTGWKYARGTTSVPCESEHTKDEELEAAMKTLKLPEQQARLHDLEARTRARERRTETLVAALETKDKEIERLRVELGTHPKRVLRSMSWRAAAPIRGLKRASAYVQHLLRARAK